MRPKTYIYGLLIGLLLLALFPFFGAQRISLGDLGNPLSVSHRIFFDLRLPRLLLAISIGGSLAALGGTYQILLQNPLAEPYILGLASAVGCGAALGEILFHLSPFSYPALGLGFGLALCVTFLLMLGSYSKLGFHLDRVILFGMGLNFVLSAALFLMMSFYHEQMGGGSLRWLLGEISWPSWHESLLFCLACFVLFAVILIYARHLDALSLGDSVAKTLGFSPRRSRNFLLLFTSLYITLIVSLGGSIGFVGLVIPHAVRLIFRPPSTRRLLLLSFALGGLFLEFSDVISRTLLPPFEFPIGIVTTLIGGPVFLYLLWKRR